MTKNGRVKRTGAPLGRVDVRFVTVPDSTERLAAIGDVVVRLALEKADGSSTMGAEGGAS